jgi:hypothetical protein
MNKIMYMSARPALTKASDAAAKAHQPFGITITTTPRMLGDLLVTISKNFLNCWKLFIKDNQQLF